MNIGIFHPNGYSADTKLLGLASDIFAGAVSGWDQHGELWPRAQAAFTAAGRKGRQRHWLFFNPMQVPYRYVPWSHPQSWRHYVVGISRYHPRSPEWWLQGSVPIAEHTSGYYDIRNTDYCTALIKTAIRKANDLNKNHDAGITGIFVDDLNYRHNWLWGEYMTQPSWWAEDEARYDAEWSDGIAAFCAIAQDLCHKAGYDYGANVYMGHSPYTAEAPLSWPGHLDFRLNENNPVDVEPHAIITPANRTERVGVMTILKDPETLEGDYHGLTYVQQLNLLKSRYDAAIDPRYDCRCYSLADPVESLVPMVVWLKTVVEE